MSSLRMLKPLSSLGCCLIAAGLSAGTPLSENPGLCEFAVYSSQESSISDRVQIVGGAVGTAGRRVEVGADSRVGTLSSRGDVFLRERAGVDGDILAGQTLSQQNGIVITGAVFENISAPVLAIPVKQVFSGTEAITLNRGQSKVLEPGSYGELHAYAGSSITLVQGTYNFSRLFFESSSVQLILDASLGPIEINVDGELRFGDQMDLQLAAGSEPSQITFYSNWNGQIKIGTDHPFFGTVIAPFAAITVFSRTEVHGALYGASVRIEPDAVIVSTPCTTEVPS